MFSENVIAEILRLTQKAKTELHSLKVVDELTILQSYLQLSAITHANYDFQLRASTVRILVLARIERHTTLIEELEALAATMDKEVAA